MPPLSNLLDKPIRDPDGEAVASLHDLVVRIHSPVHPPAGPPGGGSTPQEVYPPVSGVVARLKSPGGVRDVYIPWDQVRRMSTDGVELARPVLDLQRFQRRPDEIVLKDGLVDKQVVDVEGR